jgi:hypothetical protein
VNQKYADNDDSTGHALYMSSCAQSYGTGNNTEEADEDFFYPPSNKSQTHSYVDAARKATGKNENNNLGVTEIQFWATKTWLRAP